MTSGTTSLIAAIQAGEVTPANAISRIEKAGGEALVTLEVVRALAESTPSAGGGIPIIVTPNIIHVSSTGNDTTGDGTMAKPFLTLTKALEVGDALGGIFYSIQLGVGSFGTGRNRGNCLLLKGAGKNLTTVNIDRNGSSSSGDNAGNIYFFLQDLSVNATANGGDKSDGSGGPYYSGAGGNIYFKGANYQIITLSNRGGNVTFAEGGEGVTFVGSSGEIRAVGAEVVGAIDLAPGTTYMSGAPVTPNGTIYLFNSLVLGTIANASVHLGGCGHQTDWDAGGVSLDYNVSNYSTDQMNY